MAIALRELIARYDLDFNDKKFQQADKQISGTARVLKGLGTLLVSGLVARGFGKLIGLASHAAETQNQLSDVFGENRASVEAWASTLAATVGRSEFALAEMAGTIGAFLTPVMEGNKAAAAELATGVTALAVDMAAFFNVADDDALQALRGGLTGQTRGLLRFGVVMNDAALAQFAQAEGTQKSLEAMTDAERTALRYRFIVSKLSAVQGDAAEDAQEFAGATAGLQAALRDLGTRIGLVMLPALSRMAFAAGKVVRGFKDVLGKSNAVQAALLVLGAIALVAAGKMLIAFAPLIFAFLKMALVIGLAIIVVDDIITLFSGGQSVIGDFINMIAGPGSAEEAVGLLKEAGAGLAFVYTEQMVPALEAFGAAAFDTLTEAGEGFDLFMADVSEVTTFIEDAFTGAWTAITDGFESAKQTMQDGLTVLADAVGPVARFLGIDVPAPAPGGRQEGADEHARRTRREESNRLAAGQVGGAVGQTAGRGAGSQLVQADATAGGRRSKSFLVPAGAGASSVNQSSNITVNVPPGSSRQQASEVASHVRRVVREENRKAMAAVKQQGGGL